MWIPHSMSLFYIPAYSEIWWMLADELMHMLKISLLKKIPFSFSSLVTVKYISRGKKEQQLTSSPALRTKFVSWY